MTITRCLIIFIFACMISSCSNSDEARLKRISYNSQINGEEREYFLYLPEGYNQSDNWPVLMFLHGNGERGNGKDELDFVKIHGPLYEAWIQRRNLPFVMIVPQLHMFNIDLGERDTSIIPKRLDDGVPERIPVSRPEAKFTSSEQEMPDFVSLQDGWFKVEDDLENILNYVLENYKTDKNRVYLTGISYGGFGTWHFASTHPELFAAIAPIVGWGHPDLMEPIAKHQIPVWAFAGGLDALIEPKYFYAGLNRLKELNHSELRFTIHEDMGHDAWKRIYAGDDLYNWLLSHQKKSTQN